MIKRTLYFGNSAYLKTKNQQLVISSRGDDEKVVPIEDIGVLIMDHSQITITQPTLSRLLHNNVAVITCDERHHPIGLLLNLDGHTLQSQRFGIQISASKPLKKRLWQQTVIAKIKNQAKVLEKERHPAEMLYQLAKQVKSGDPDNCEAQAANYYWRHLFPDFLAFTRDRDGAPPNNLLNYGYAILRASVARSLIGSGLLPTLGIFHRNQYNAYCLADDIMEPYRPYVDLVVCDIVRMNGKFLDMTTGMKTKLLKIPAIDMEINGEIRPLMVGLQTTTSSLVKCFSGLQANISYPTLHT